MTHLPANKSQAILTVRHACSTCGDEGFDLCSSCVVEAKTIHPGHALAPVFLEKATGQSIFSKHRMMWGRAPISHTQPENMFDAYIYSVDSNAAIDVTVSKHWRMRIAVERNYESEPDEGGRIRTRFKGHCDRGRSARFATAKTGHRRQRRSKSHILLLKREFPVKSHDLVPATLDDNDLWENIIADSSSGPESLILKKIEDMEQKLRAPKAQRQTMSDHKDKSPSISLGSISTLMTRWVRIMV
jgi:hypothetical protein